MEDPESAKRLDFHLTSKNWVKNVNFDEINFHGGGRKGTFLKALDHTNSTHPPILNYKVI